MRIGTGCRAAAMSVVVAAFLVSCTSTSSGGGPGGDVPEVPAADAASAQAPTPSPAPESGGAVESIPSPGPVAVRDAFAGLQATLNETCTPGAGDCAYFLGRVTAELQELDTAMKADAQGPDHFEEPLARTGTLWKTLAGDTSAENLEKHRDELVDTRDRVNTWMLGHPEDYR